MKVSISIIALISMVSASPLITSTHGNTEISAAPHRGPKTVHHSANARTEVNDKYYGSEAQENLRTTRTDNAHADLVLDTSASHPNVTHSAQNAGVAIAQAAVDAKDQTVGGLQATYYAVKDYTVTPAWNGVKWVGRQADNALVYTGHANSRFIGDLGAAAAHAVNGVTSTLHQGTASVAESLDEVSDREYALQKNARAKIAIENDKASELAREGYHAVADKAQEYRESAAAKMEEMKEAAARKAHDARLRAEQEQREYEANHKQVKKVSLKQEEVKPVQYVEEEIYIEETDKAVLAEQARLRAAAKAEFARGVANQKLSEAEQAAARQAQKTADALNRRANAHGEKANARFSASASEEKASRLERETEVVKTSTTLVNNGTLVDSASNTTVTYPNGTTTKTAAAASAGSFSATLALGAVVASALFLL